MDWITTKEAAELWGITMRQVESDFVIGKHFIPRISYIIEKTLYGDRILFGFFFILSLKFSRFFNKMVVCMVVLKSLKCPCLR